MKVLFLIFGINYVKIPEVDIMNIFSLLLLKKLIN